MSRKSCQYGGCLLCGSQLRLKSLSVIIVIIKELVQTCVVHGCGSTWRPGGDIRFHAFPKNSTQRKLWLSIVPLKMKFYESVRICNLHFQESDYDSTTRRSKQTAFPAIITNQEAVSPCKIASSLHEDSMVPIAAVAVPSTSSGTYESNSSHKEMGVKRTGCNIKDQTSKKQCRKFLGNISNLNILPVSSEDHVPAKIDRGVQVNIKSTKEKILQKKSKIHKQKVARQTKKLRYPTASEGGQCFMYYIDNYCCFVLNSIRTSNK